MELENKSLKISNKELIFLTNGSVVGLVWVYLPRTLCMEAKQNAWLAILISVIYPILSWVLIERVLRRYPGQSFYKVSSQLFGKIIGPILFVPVIFYFMLFSGTIISNFARLVKVYALPQTPILIITIIIVLCAIFVGTKGIKVTAWFDELSLYLILILMLVYCLPIPVGDYTNLLPLGQVPLQNLSRAILQAVWAQAGVETLLIFYYLLDSPQKVIKAGFISIGLNTLIYLWVTTICILVMGADLTQQFLWPGLTVLKVSYVSIIERLEFFFLVLVFLVVSRTLITSQVAGACALTGALPAGQQYYPYMLLFMALGSLSIAVIPRNIIDVFSFGGYTAYMSLVVGIAYPLLYLFLANLRGEKVGSRV